MSSAATVAIADPAQRAYALSHHVFANLERQEDKSAYEAAVGECRDLVAAGNTPAFVTKMLDQRDVLFGAQEAEDIEGAFLLLFSFLPEIRSDEDYRRVSLDLVSVIASEGASAGAGASGGAPSADSAELRLNLLAHLYNLVEMRNGAKLEVFLRLLQFAEEAGLLTHVEGFLRRAGSLPRRWKLDRSDARRLYLAVARGLHHCGEEDAAQVLRVQCLRTFESCPAEELRQAREVARDAALTYISSPALGQRSQLPSLAAVRALEADEEYAPLFELLSIFATGRLGDYRAFQERHAQHMRALALDEDSMMETIRLLTLASLATDRDTVHFNEIADALQVDKSEVEEWVVRAISRGLIEGRMDEMSEQVAVSRATAREFEEQQWEQLAERLHKWREHVGSMIQTIKSQTPAAAGAGGGRR